MSQKKADSPDGQHISNAITPQCKALFISGFNVDHFQGDMILADGTELLKKPFVVPELTDKIRKMLD